MNLCANIELKHIFKARENTYSKFHAFGTQYNCSEPEIIIGRCALPFPSDKGEWLPITEKFFGGSVSFIWIKTSCNS